MNKYIVGVSIAISSLGIAYAEEVGVAVTQKIEVKTNETRPQLKSAGNQNEGRPGVMKAKENDEGQHGEGEAMMTTGDVAIDAKVKALIMERDAKLRAIHEEYKLKMKTLIGERKMMNGSSTRPMMHGQGSTTRPTMKGQLNMKTDVKARMDSPEVRGDYKEEVGADISAEAQGGIRAFFSKIFGR